MERNAFPASKATSSYYFNYFHNPELHGGGAIMDQGTYGIDYAVWLLGRPASVFAIGKKLRGLTGLKAEDEGWAMLDYPKATAVVWGGWWVLLDTGSGVGEIMLTSLKGVFQRILGTVTFAQGGDAEKGIKARPNLQPVAAPPIPRERQNGVAHFVDSIRNKKAFDVPHSPALNVIVQGVVDAACKSIRSGGAENLP